MTLDCKESDEEDGTSRAVLGMLLRGVNVNETKTGMNISGNDYSNHCNSFDLIRKLCAWEWVE